MTPAVLPLAGKRHVLLAVSGGSDSTALLVLAARQASQLANPPKLTAVTVDHGLRAGSAAEARAVAGLSARLGIGHETMSWTGSKPVSGIQAAARQVRRTLIAKAACDTGADLVLTGHTLDDQRETVAMRAARGPGPGLAGIAPASLVFDDLGSGAPVWFARPLLGQTRETLRGFLLTQGISWIDDPSNDNAMFERVAVRQRLAGYSDVSLAELDALQDKTAVQRIEIAAKAGQLVRDHTFRIMPGLILVDRGFFDASADEARLTALRALLSFAGGSPVSADEAHAAKIFAAAAGHRQGSPAIRHGAGGALADNRAEGVYLLQERRKLSGSERPFTGRYRLLARNAEHPALSAASDTTQTAPVSLVRHALAAEPMFERDDGLSMRASEAAQTGKALRLLVNPWPDLVPSFDHDLASSLAALAGAAALPDLPA